LPQRFRLSGWFLLPVPQRVSAVKANLLFQRGKECSLLFGWDGSGAREFGEIVLRGQRRRLIQAPPLRYIRAAERLSPCRRASVWRS